MKIDSARVEALLQQVKSRKDRLYLKQVFEELIRVYNIQSPEPGIVLNQQKKRLSKRALDTICRIGIEIGKHELIGEFLDLIRHFD